MLYCLGIALILALALARNIKYTPRFAGFIDIFARLNLQYYLAGIILYLFFPVQFAVLVDRIKGPAVVFCLTWIGVKYGAGMEMRAFQSIRIRLFVFTMLVPIAVFAAVFAGGLIFSFAHKDSSISVTAVMAAALFGSICFPDYMKVMGRTGQNDQEPPIVRKVINLVPLIILVILGATVNRSSSFNFLGISSGGFIPYLAGTVIAGIICAGIVNLILSGVSTSSLAFAVIAGTALAGGIAYYYSFSPLFFGVLSGVFIVNATLKRLDILAMVDSVNPIVEKLYLVILGVYTAGTLATMKSAALILLLPACMMFAFLLVFKYWISLAWVRYFSLDRESTAEIMTGLAGQGILAAAVAFESTLYHRQTPVLFIVCILVLIGNQSVMAFRLRKKHHAVKEGISHA